jgi:hypothetical protein
LSSGVTDKDIMLTELENYLGSAANSLRAALILCKNNGAGKMAAELTGAALVIDAAHRQAGNARMLERESVAAPLDVLLEMANAPIVDFDEQEGPR